MWGITSSAANSSSFKVTLRTDRDMRMTRLFDAPARDVFDALTTPARIREWWCRLDEDYSVPVCETDLRVGGRWRFVSRFPWGEATRYGEYREIVAPRRLVHTQVFEELPTLISVVAIDLAEESGKTRLTATVEYPTLVIRDMILASGASSVAALSYDRLESHLGAARRPLSRTAAPTSA